MKRKKEITDDGIKRMGIDEFRRLGYLQELNRQFLHPLGLALEIITSDGGTEKLGGIWDYREDPEGIYYEIANADEDTFKGYKKKKEFIQDQFLQRAGARKKLLGFVIEPLKDKLK